MAGPIYNYNPNRERKPNWKDYLTERSMKFYDGTYKWNLDGYWDEHDGKI